VTRPKGSSDKKKRKKKVILSGSDERKLIDLYCGGESIRNLRLKYNLSKSAISSLFSERGVGKRIDHSQIKLWESVEHIDDLEDDICGVYSLCFLWNYKKDDPLCYSKINDIKIYVGSSSNIKQRLNAHGGHLKRGIHESQKLNEYYNNKDYTMVMKIVERCDEKIVTSRENYYQNKFNKSCLLNSWISKEQDDLLPWLQKAITFKAYKNFTINSNGCWESKSVHKSGYARLCVVAHKDWGPGEKKYFYSHRVAYWEKYGEYPELIRHLCDNPKCRNPDHLAKGNYRDNALDKRGDFPIEFEKVWIECCGDLKILSDHFSDRWSANQEWKGEMVSYSVYSWEKKLGLVEKYPDIVEARSRGSTNNNYRGK
jgi:hypothetical protein